MDVDDAIILTIAIWTLICLIFVDTIDVFITLLLIGLLIVAEIGNNFMKSDVKNRLKPTIYFLLFIFSIIVAKKILEVLR